MSVRRISAVLCTALALTFAGGNVALAHSIDGSDTGDCHGPNAIRGTNGDDVLDATKAPYDPNIQYTICGFGGNDTIIANNAGDFIYGGPGNDTIYGGTGNDYIEGQGGDDKIFDCTLNSTDCVAPNNAYLGGGGADTILGQTGNDTINSADGVPDFLVDGGTGNNHCTVDTSEKAVKNC